MHCSLLLQALIPILVLLIVIGNTIEDYNIIRIEKIHGRLKKRQSGADFQPSKSHFVYAILFKYSYCNCQAILLVW